VRPYLQVQRQSCYTASVRRYLTSLLLVIPLSLMLNQGNYTFRKPQLQAIASYILYKFIIPLWRTIFYLQILCILDVKYRPPSSSSFHATVNQLPDDDQKIGRNMSYCKSRKRVILEVVFFWTYNYLYYLPKRLYNG
jgi:hypothetical protein